MNRLGKLIYTHDFGHEVYAVAWRDNNSRRMSVDLYIVYNDGSMSDIVTIPRKDVYKKKNFCDFFFDFDGDFGRDEIDKIVNAVKDICNRTEVKESQQGRATMVELHRAVSNYITVNQEELSDNTDAEVFVKNGYGYMTTGSMDKFISEHKELGYKRLEVLKRLKIMGALKNGKDRPYDLLVSIDNKKRRFYKIELAEIVEENAEEVIEI